MNGAFSEQKKNRLRIDMRFIALKLPAFSVSQSVEITTILMYHQRADTFNERQTGSVSFTIQERLSVCQSSYRMTKY